MLTRNYYLGLLYYTFGKGSLPTSASYIDSNGAYVAFGDNITNDYGVPSAMLAPALVNKVGTRNSGLYFGSNDAEETFNDYTWGTTLNFTATIGTYYPPVYNEEDKTYTFTRRYVLTNNTNAPLTINCFAIAGNPQYNNPMLLYRKLLDEPFTVNVGETINFDLSLTYEMISDFEPYVPA